MLSSFNVAFCCHICFSVTFYCDVKLSCFRVTFCSYSAVVSVLCLLQCLILLVCFVSVLRLAVRFVLMVSFVSVSHLAFSFVFMSCFAGQFCFSVVFSF